MRPAANARTDLCRSMSTVAGIVVIRNQIYNLILTVCDKTEKFCLFHFASIINLVLSTARDIRKQAYPKAACICECEMQVLSSQKQITKRESTAFSGTRFPFDRYAGFHYSGFTVYFAPVYSNLSMSKRWWPHGTLGNSSATCGNNFLGSE